MLGKLVIFKISNLDVENSIKRLIERYEARLDGK